MRKSQDGKLVRQLDVAVLLAGLAGGVLPRNS